MGEDIAVDVVNQIAQFLSQGYDSHQMTVVRWFLIFYTILVFLGLGLLLMKNPQLWDYSWYGNKTKKTLEKKAKRRPPSPWKNINEKVNSASPNDWKIAVIEADKLFDKALIDAGFVGENMGERMRGLKNSDIDGNTDALWEAHKTRNSIVHDSNYDIDDDKARKTVNTLEKAYNALMKR